MEGAGERGNPDALRPDGGTGLKPRADLLPEAWIAPLAARQLRTGQVAAAMRAAAPSRISSTETCISALGSRRSVLVSTSRTRGYAPMSAVVAAARSLFGTTQGVAEPSVWSLQHPVITTLGMSVLLLGVMVPLAVRRYSRAVR
jgi:hypothetical protein